jgi:hypothetical protein
MEKIMSNNMIPHNEVPVTLQREHKARLNHVDHTKLVTQATLDANAEIYRHGFSNYCHGLNDGKFMVDAFCARHGDDNKAVEAMEAAYLKWAEDFQASNRLFYEIYGEILMAIVKNIPPEPRDVGFWEEIASRIRAFVLDESDSKHSKLDEIQMLVRDAKEQLSNASKAHLQELKTVLHEMAS